MHADVLFLGVGGFDADFGVTTPNLLESRVNRAMVKAARRVVAVCDSTKLGLRSLSRIAQPSEVVDVVISDKRVTATAAETMRSDGIAILLV